MKSYKLESGQFVEIDSPVDEAALSRDWVGGITEAGYSCQITSELADSAEGAAVRLYQRDKAPRYFLDIVGSGEGIATVVADDFPSLMQTLKELHPLLTLVRMDQAGAIEIDASIRRDEKKGTR